MRSDSYALGQVRAWQRRRGAATIDRHSWQNWPGTTTTTPTTTTTSTTNRRD